MSHDQFEGLRERARAIEERAKADPAYLSRVQADPGAALQEMGLTTADLDALRAGTVSAEVSGYREAVVCGGAARLSLFDTNTDPFTKLPV